ncbi:hypothetical protein SODALDRAFT_181296 [Sodiomyces alkalinus F11]|uniref:Uncharacterized protein n=1 Tax=Sodiomyces alkalinus (strain CBS 110278 / VKM F-3762 / F11) TaxID=1314773 RepID=A0A3N2PU93_SODAK|nr:hypothetical protein SODALDRAFT_181296 [Sodiomyces alkalinus F11]ROT38088.1 hypothetical protein SODALDRAFT_181296 [Sodiomyces alkalinus F11]
MLLRTTSFFGSSDNRALDVRSVIHDKENDAQDKDATNRWKRRQMTSSSSVLLAHRVIGFALWTALARTPLLFPSDSVFRLVLVLTRRQAAREVSGMGSCLHHRIACMACLISACAPWASVISIFLISFVSVSGPVPAYVQRSTFNRQMNPHKLQLLAFRRFVTPVRGLAGGRFDPDRRVVRCLLKPVSYFSLSLGRFSTYRLPP